MVQPGAVVASTSRQSARPRVRWNRASALGRLDVAHPFVSAILLVLVAFAVRLLLGPILISRSPFLLFTASTVIAAGRYGMAPGMVATAGGLLLGTFVFLAPGFPPQLTTEQSASLGVFIITSAAMLSFARHLRRSRRREQQLQASLQQVHTETAMGTMAATLAHELNQPLAAAANYVSAGKRIAAKAPPDVQESLLTGLNEAEGQLHRAGEIIRHARNLVSNASADRQPTSLGAMISNVVKPLQASGTCERMKMRLRIDAGADELFVNPIQIEQVLLNVIRNACQAAGPAATPAIVISATSGERFVTVEIRDFGPGITKDRMKTLFAPEPSSGTGGLGLGLSISRTIVEAHGGKMWAKNNAGGGASFFFAVPYGPDAV